MGNVDYMFLPYPHSPQLETFWQSAGGALAKCGQHGQFGRVKIIAGLQHCAEVPIQIYKSIE